MLLAQFPQSNSATCQRHVLYCTAIGEAIDRESAARTHLGVLVQGELADRAQRVIAVRPDVREVKHVDSLLLPCLDRLVLGHDLNLERPRWAADVSQYVRLHVADGITHSPFWIASYRSR